VWVWYDIFTNNRNEVDNMHIQENITLTAHNLISYRGTHTAQELRTITETMETYIATYGVAQTGKLIMALHTTCKTTGATDAQVYLPVGKVLPDGEGFTFVPQLDVQNCLLVRFEGMPQQVPEVFVALLEKANEVGNSIKPPAYIVAENQLAGNSNRLDADVYVEVEHKI